MSLRCAWLLWSGFDLSSACWHSSSIKHTTYIGHDGVGHRELKNCADGGLVMLCSGVDAINELRCESRSSAPIGPSASLANFGRSLLLLAQPVPRFLMQCLDCPVGRPRARQSCQTPVIGFLRSEIISNFCLRWSRMLSSLNTAGSFAVLSSVSERSVLVDFIALE